MLRLRSPTLRVTVYWTSVTGHPEYRLDWQSHLTQAMTVDICPVPITILGLVSVIGAMCETEFVYV